MARFFPVRSQCRFDTSGERRFAERLDKLLEDDYLCWHNVPVGPRVRYPDFVVLHPRRGVLVLEVKDWRLTTIHRADKGSVELLTNEGLKRVANPLTQARVYALELQLLLKADPLLRQNARSPRPGELIMPWGWGLVLSNITRRQFEQTDLGEVLNPQQVICQDEMTESADPEAFQERLWGMFPQVFPCALSLPQIDRVRYHLFPEVRVSAQPGQFGLFGAGEAELPSLIRVMDFQQEQLARSLGEGHRVIHGVAGSGKTMILGYRCAHLAKVSMKPILVLCFNRSLAARLRQVMAEKGLGEKVVVQHFHGWCKEMLAAYNVDAPPGSRDVDAYLAALVERTMDAVERGLIPRAQYAAVMIDEGHDFEPDWFRLVVQMVDPSSNSLLVLYDDAQSIYRSRKKGLDFSFASVGIQAQGRTTVLKLNYRNTLEVLTVARAFADDLLSGREAGEDGVPIITPQSAGRRGAFPELIACAGDREEWELIVARLQDERDAGRAWGDMAILYRYKRQAAVLEQVLARAGIPFASGAGNGKARDELFGERDSVKIVSMHSSKGLEFGLVVIPMLGQMPDPREDEADEARLLYVAMTRAIDRLLMTYQQASDFTQRVQKAIGGVRSELREVLEA